MTQDSHLLETQRSKMSEMREPWRDPQFSRLEFAKIMLREHCWQRLTTKVKYVHVALDDFVLKKSMRKELVFTRSMNQNSHEWCPRHSKRQNNICRISWSYSVKAALYNWFPFSPHPAADRGTTERAVRPSSTLPGRQCLMHTHLSFPSHAHIHLCAWDAECLVARCLHLDATQVMMLHV